jgi:oxygen-independent coproporphyrinogen-3 oxidase
MFKPQRRINEAELPSAADKLVILKNFVEQLGTAGYVYIGMDHFAKPTDELALAQREGRLHRNFQGYSTHANCDMVGLGISSIGKVNNCYAQNEKSAEAYYARLDAGSLPLIRGKKLFFDDLIRHYVIMELMCQFKVDKKVVEYKFGVEFDKYFAAALDQLATMQTDGLVSVNSRQINVEPSGKWFIRNICMTFDAYLQNDKGVLYSKVV